MSNKSSKQCDISVINFYLKIILNHNGSCNKYNENLSDNIISSIGTYVIKYIVINSYSVVLKLGESYNNLTYHCSKHSGAVFTILRDGNLHHIATSL